MQLTDKQKKAAWIVGAVILIVHFLPNILGAVERTYFSFVHPVPAVVQKPSPVHVTPVAPPPAPPPSPEAAAASKYGGIWGGNALMPDQNRCTIKLEIRLSDDLPKKLKGYESKSCFPVQPFAGGKGVRGQTIEKIVRDTAPVSAVMTGSPVEGGMKFTVDSLIGTPYDGCRLVGMTLTDFGKGQLQAEWESQSAPQTPCPAGNMLLQKARG